MYEILNNETLLKIEEFEVYNVTVENNKMTGVPQLKKSWSYRRLDGSTETPIYWGSNAIENSLPPNLT
tara:strand:+ start:91 stop:294 length:204 start_codon:yes stop_codon:yes gene_type:complete